MSCLKWTDTGRRREARLWTVGNIFRIQCPMNISLPSILSAFFFFKSLNHQLHSYNSDRHSAPFHPTPLWPVMGIAAWLHPGASSCAGVRVKFESSCCPLCSCQCTTARSRQKPYSRFTAVFLLQDMKYSLSRVSIGCSDS